MGGDIDRIGTAEAASALAWWLEAGVDTAVQEDPRDWLKAEATAPPAAPVAEPQPAPQAPLPETLDLFRDWLRQEQTLPLASAAARRVLPRGAEGAPVMLLADAPASEDAEADQPIAGDAWALTERMLAAIGLSADEAYVANISCFHAPGRRLSAAEIESCAAIARRHIALARPKRLLLLGEGPARAMLGKALPEARNHAHTIEGVRTVATFAPRFLLAHAENKRLAWQDLLLLMEDSQ